MKYPDGRPSLTKAVVFPVHAPADAEEQQNIFLNPSAVRPHSPLLAFWIFADFGPGLLMVWVVLCQRLVSGCCTFEWPQVSLTDAFFSPRTLLRCSRMAV